MASGRNDPCPCGSGKKYKACCLPGDQARARTHAVTGGAEPAWHPHARAATVWEADVVPLAVSVGDDPDAAPALAMVVAAGFVVSGDTHARRPTTTRERARVVADTVRAGGRVLGALPEVLRVRDEALAGALREELSGAEIAVEAGAIDELDEALDSALEHLTGSPAGSRICSLVTWSETGADERALADYHAAAAEYHEAEPWMRWDDDSPLLLVLADGSSWTACVMGGAGVETGLALYSHPVDLFRTLDGDHSPDEQVQAMEGFSISTSYDPRSHLRRPMQREVAARGWRVASPEAYPMLLGINLPERRITAEHVRIAATALRAVAAFSRGDRPDPAEVLSVVQVLEETPPWPIPDEPQLLCAEGDRAEPEAALRSLDYERRKEVEELEEARLARMSRWLEATAPSKAARAADVRNARLWTDFLQFSGLSVGAMTEYDLRLFLYSYYPMRASAPKTAARVLPRSMRRILSFVAEDGVRYPFGERVLDELDRLASDCREHGEPLDAVLEEMASVVYEDLDARGMIPDQDLPGTPSGWPPSMSPELAGLRHELQRRWLLWYDGAVRKGITDLVTLRQVLVGRQREWENTPHPGVSGRTPAEVVRAYASHALE